MIKKIQVEQKADTERECSDNLTILKKVSMHGRVSFGDGFPSSNSFPLLTFTLPHLYFITYLWNI
jgi:hypothetical protein